MYPRVQVDVAPVSGVGQAGGVLLTETVRATGLDQALSAATAPGRRPLAQHDSGKVLLDLALALAPGGDCLADVASVPAEPDVYGPAASDPLISRLLTLLDRKSTRLNSSHVAISYAVFCLKKKI